MKFYTVEEMVEDIYDKEGVEILLTKMNFLFTRLYSDIYPKPLSDKNTDSDLKKRIKTIVEGKGDHVYVLPKVDVFPKEDRGFTLYSCGHNQKTLKNKSVDIEDVDRLTYRGDFDRKEEVMKAMGTLVDTICFIVVHETGAVISYSRSLQ
ncbi:MAG TPA: hypothetical protein VN843_24105 [Anaerolineales bacterium]|nr:hypothetical protein [Anaerolineales bacterium]